jgi:hypothetical protein
MARTRLTVVEAPKTHPGGSVTYAWEAADTTDQNDFLTTGREVLLIKSADAGSQDVVIASAPDAYGRSQDLTVAVAAGEEEAVAFLQRDGWMQPDGSIHLDCSVATISYAVIRLP